MVEDINFGENDMKLKKLIASMLEAKLENMSEVMESTYCKKSDLEVQLETKMKSVQTLDQQVLNLAR